MARIGREEKGASSFFSSVKPVPCKPKTKSKKKKKSGTSADNRAVKEQTDLLITKAKFDDNAQIKINTKELEPVPKPILISSVGRNQDSGKYEGRGDDFNLDADPLISTASDDDTYSPLLRFICEHSFMRDKQYPVSLSSRQQFVRDVHEEARELGYEEKEVDRVLLDIKRYCLKSVGSAAAFSDGIEFGDEVDDSSPASHETEVPGTSNQKTFKHKREEALARADSLVEKRLVNTTSLSRRIALTARDASDYNDVDEKGKLSKFQRKRKRKRERRQAGDEVRSKYFMYPNIGNYKNGRAADSESSPRVRKHRSIPDHALKMAEDMNMLSDILLSDSTLSDVPSDFDPLPGNPRASPDRSLSLQRCLTECLEEVTQTPSEPVTPIRCVTPCDAREHTSQPLDLPLGHLLIPEKRPRLKPTRISRYFQRPFVNEDSCLPFPPIDAPAFGLVQEQLAHDPFRLLLATIFLNRTRGGVALPILFQVFDRYPTIEAMAAANPHELVSMIHRLGFQNQRARKCIALAQTWLKSPPSRGKRYRKLNYPRKTDGRDVKAGECIDDEDQRTAWEIAHLPGVGAYALDSWRIFCRDELRGLAKDWRGNGAASAGFVPEWKSVLPQDKELRAYLTWMWLKEDLIWDRETGQTAKASEKVMRAARRGTTAHIEDGNWVLETSPVKPSSAMFLPLRLNDRERNRKLSSSSSASLKSKHRPHRSSSQKQSSRPSTKDPDDPEPPVRASTPSASAPKSRKQRRSSMPGLDSASRSGTASFLESRTSLPYPTFSKAHSREAVGKPGVPTPDPTDLTEHNRDDEDKVDSKQQRPASQNAPPSPPLTSVDQHSRKGSTVDDKGEKSTEKVKDGKTKIRIKTELNRSSSSLRAKKDDSSKSSKVTVRPETPKSTSKRSSHSKDSPTRTTSHKPSKSKLDQERKRTTVSPSRSPPTVRDAGLGSANGSDATIAAPRQSPSRVKSPEKPPSRNQTRSSMSNRPASANRNRAPYEVAMEYGRPSTVGSTYGTPPPPPPPPDVPVSNPRVDYLLQNGGLDYQVPKSLLLSTAFGDQAQLQPHLAASKTVMNKNGSLAVATGSRSAVFARDISSESCGCLVCVSWGEVLELVSGRRELPNWPPFLLTAELGAADLSGEEHIPMQKLDIDVPEEYRDHFLRQSRKTKLAVDKWLSEQVEQPTSAPEEVDDETLTFAMLTHLGTEQRPMFRALLGISSTSPTPRPDGQPRERPAALISSSYAIQRLYRLPSRPRDPETAMYMLNNPGIHHVLATLAAISDDEWDILISGRFDGFLRSGAEDSLPNGTPNRWSHSRSNTPFSAGGRMSRGPTPSPLDRPMSQPYGGPGSPGSFGGPIALDEEMEIAALAEVEREIYAGMEALEDAFEALHCKAEAVRLALRERGAGLSIANQNRRGTYVEARLGTPASQYPWESGTDDDFLDDTYSLAPDDSASNISSNRRRRPKRRTERRTPAPVEEEDEGEEGEAVGRRDSRNSRRR
ncbi:hypothetical protein BDW67DRAFT_172779 [Aspergillus spinulosporus]